MTRTQNKKRKAHLFNLRRAERLAYEMDAQLFPVPVTTLEQRRRITRNGRLSKLGLITVLAAAMSI
jgi:hypothetical protein